MSRVSRTWLNTPVKPARRWMVLLNLVLTIVGTTLREKRLKDLERRIEQQESGGSILTDSQRRELNDLLRRR